MERPHAQFEFNLEDLGFEDTATEIKSVILSRVLNDLCIRYKKFFSKKSDRSWKRARGFGISPEDLTLKFDVECDEYHLKYIVYEYKKRMRDIISLERCMQEDYIKDDV